MKKKTLIVSAVIIVFVFIALIVVPLIIDVNTYKPRVETVLSNAMGMDVKIQGDMHIMLLPDFSISLKDVNVRGKDTDFCIVKEAKVDLELSSLIHGEIKILEVELVNPTFNVVKNKDGVFNFEKAGEPSSPSSITLPHIEKFSISKGDVIYLDEKNKDKFMVNGLDLNLENVSVDKSSDKNLIQKISLDGDVKINTLKSEVYKISTLNLRIKARKGVFQLLSISQIESHGKGKGSITMDLTKRVPTLKVQYRESGFKVEEMLQRLSQEEILKGKIDFTLDLSMKGKDIREIKQTLNGEVFITGEKLMLYGLDIDEFLSKFDKSQHYNLIDVGAFFFAGPLGPAITKGRDFAAVYGEFRKEKSSIIQKLVCSWNVKNGVAEVKDVALATKMNRIAMVGKLDLVNQQFVDVTVAVLDSKGCAVLSQEMHGSFSKPKVKTIGTIQALVGPVVGVIDNTTKILLRKKCKVFYTGSLEHPEVKKKGLF